MTKEYVGLKQITAWEQEEQNVVEGQLNRPGYAVRYADGYISWSPEDVFEDAYHEINEDSDSLHPGVVSLLKYFRYEHLPPHLAKRSKPFCLMAKIIAAGPPNAETTVALRKLLEAKDAAVRAYVE